LRVERYAGEKEGINREHSAERSTEGKKGVILSRFFSDRSRG
jgi:hypothetical protein